MSNASMLIIVFFIAVFLFVVALLIVKHNKGKSRSTTKISGFGASVESSVSNEVLPGVRVDDARSRLGGIVARDQTGRGVDAKKLDVAKDITLTNESPPNPK